MVRALPALSFLLFALGCGEMGHGSGLARSDPWTLSVSDGFAREPGLYDWPNPYTCALRWNGRALYARCDDAAERAVPPTLAEPVVRAVTGTDWDDVRPMHPDEMLEGGSVDTLVFTEAGETQRGSSRTVTDAVYLLRRRLWGPGAACTSDADCRQFPCVDGECRSRCEGLDARDGEVAFIMRTGCGPLSVAQEGTPRWVCVDPITCAPAER